MNGKTAIVTGVGVGLGREVAAALLEQGARVVIAARSGERLAEVAAELDPTGDSILAKTVFQTTDAHNSQPT